MRPNPLPLSGLERGVPDIEVCGYGKSPSRIELRFLWFLLLLISLYSCTQPVVWDEGEEVTRFVRTVNYDTIEFRGIFDVLLVQDTTAFVKITCGENLINYVRTHLRKGYIEINETSKMNWTRSFKRTFVEMHFTQIHHICIHEGVNMVTEGAMQSPFLSIWDCSGVSETDLEIECSGFKLTVSEDNSGIYKVRGRAGYTCLEPDGSAHFRMENLAVDSCHIHHKGIGDCYVNAQKAIEGEITARGTLFYKPYPSLRVNILNERGRIVPLSAPE